ncbi:hypothetical protein TNCV_3001631 [Trichonephila clavipes]|nr:hypothetical protein TNCV_3001631 [Trichonephila clavipes]
MLSISQNMKNSLQRRHIRPLHAGGRHPRIGPDYRKNSLASVAFKLFQLTEPIELDVGNRTIETPVTLPDDAPVLPVPSGTELAGSGHQKGALGASQDGEQESGFEIQKPS